MAARQCLVTGGGGFIGSHLVEQLLQDRRVPVMFAVLLLVAALRTPVHMSGRRHVRLPERQVLGDLP